jgi:hypothetical protein
LLGQIPVHDGESKSAKKRGLQSDFKSFRHQGDLFRPGNELLKYIQNNARPHICNRLCPGGTLIYEEWMADQMAASKEAQEAFSQAK